jgi:hypothetical protein
VKNARMPSRTAADSIILSLGCVALLATIAGCGYHFAAEGTSLPPQDQTVYVERFTNRSRYTGLGDEFDRYMKDEIAQRKRLQLVDDRGQADLVLSGELIYVWWRLPIR